VQTANKTRVTDQPSARSPTGRSLASKIANYWLSMRALLSGMPSFFRRAMARAMSTGQVRVARKAFAVGFGWTTPLIHPSPSLDCRTVEHPPAGCENSSFSWCSVTLAFSLMIVFLYRAVRHSRLAGQLRLQPPHRPC
jgi:hypothetical protein